MVQNDVTVGDQCVSLVPRQSICTYCVMDDSDPDITFDERGECNHCRWARRRLHEEVFTGQDGQHRLREIVHGIRCAGRGKEYDCILGLSGGIDSSYAALRTVELGLRPLAIHMDNGWNSELAVGNIEKIVSKLGIDLVTHVIDWEEIKDLQRSFFRASIINIEAVTDHAIFALLYHECSKRGIRYQINGSNVATESIMPRSWGYDARDARHILAIHKRFGDVALKTYPVLEPWTFIYYVFVKRIKFIPILNYGTYVKADAIRRLKSEFGWVPYGRKHGESKFTQFYQEYILPRKLNADKRKAHYSSLICADQMTRDEALAELNKPRYEHRELEEDIKYIIKKFKFTKDELERFLSEPPKSHRDYPSFSWMFSDNNRLTQLVRRIAKGQ